MQTYKKLSTEKSADPFTLLAERVGAFLPDQNHQFNAALFQDIAFYIKKRMNSLIDEAGVLALLEGAVIRMEERITSSDAELLNPVAYYRTIIRNLVNDYYRDMLSDERFLISTESIELLAAYGFPQKAINLLKTSISTKLITLRTLRGKLKTVFDTLEIASNRRHYLQREAIKVFRFQISKPLEKTQLENIPEEATGNNSLSQLGDCLKQFKKKDRDLIRLKFGLDGIHLSFEEIRELYQAPSTRQIQNRYYYLLKGLRSCLEMKGYRFG